MAELKYTKGEWHLEHGANVMSGNRCVASCGAYFDSSNPDKSHNENLANAHLISASPDMYEALKEIKRLIKEYPPKVEGFPAIFSYDKFCEQADKALAKAEGK